MHPLHTKQVLQKSIYSQYTSSWWHLPIKAPPGKNCCPVLTQCNVMQLDWLYLAAVLGSFQRMLVALELIWDIHLPVRTLQHNIQLCLGWHSGGQEPSEGSLLLSWYQSCFLLYDKKQSTFLAFPHISIVAWLPTLLSLPITLDFFFKSCPRLCSVKVSPSKCCTENIITVTPGNCIKILLENACFPKGSPAEQKSSKFLPSSLCRCSTILEVEGFFAPMCYYLFTDRGTNLSISLPSSSVISLQLLRGGWQLL